MSGFEYFSASPAKPHGDILYEILFKSRSSAKWNMGLRVLWKLVWRNQRLLSIQLRENMHLQSTLHFIDLSSSAHY